MKKILAILLSITIIVTCSLCFAACNNSKEITTSDIKGKTYNFVSFTTCTTLYSMTFTLSYNKGENYNNNVLKADSIRITFDKKELKGNVSVDEAFYGAKTYNFTYIVENGTEITANVENIGEISVSFVNDLLVFSTSKVTGEHDTFYLQNAK